MNKLATDLHYIKWGLLALLLALGIGGAFLLLSQSFLDSAQQAHHAAETGLRKAQHDLSTATSDQQNMADYTQEYAMLLNRNVIGKEQRLDWIDGLERLRQRNIVLGFKYVISPQQPYQPPEAVDSGNFSLNRSDMTLSFELLHTGQLVRFFKELRTRVKGWYMLDGCSIERLDNTEPRASAGLTPQLRAECTGGWLTLQNRNAP